MAIKYRIRVMSSERGWGKEYWHEDYDTFEEADQRIYEINSKNVSLTAPDYYEQADTKIEAVNVSLVPQGYI